MLQFILNGKSAGNARQLVDAVVEGGCRWVQVSASAADDSESSLKELVENLIPSLKEQDAFLVIEDDVDLVDELKVHGVFLRDNSRETVMQARERLGAHAVIGVRGESLAQIKGLKGLDVDYVMVPAEAMPADSNPLSVAAAYGELIKGIRGEGIDFHVVATGDFTLFQLPALIEAGCAGVAMSDVIAEAESPEAETARIIDILDRARFGNGVDDADSVGV